MAGFLASGKAPSTASPAFEEIARGAQFRDRIAVRVKAPPVRFDSRQAFDTIGVARSGWFGRSVRATQVEATKVLPGDSLIVAAKGSLTHAITIQSALRDVWPWLAQMGAGSRAGWYSYDRLDNRGKPSASRILPELQRLSVGMVFPAVPDATDGFTLLAFEPERFLIIGWRSPSGGAPLMTWTFVLEETATGSTRLIARARVGPAYGFHNLPWWIGKRVTRVVHFVMQRKQLLGIARRAERCASGSALSEAQVTFFV